MVSSGVISSVSPSFSGSITQAGSTPQSGSALQSGQQASSLQGTSPASQISDYTSLFSKGEIVEGTILSTSNGRAEVEFKGVQLTADSGLQLKSGQQIRAMVEDVDAGKVHLRLLDSSAEMASAEGRILKGLGLDSMSAENRAALQQLLESGVPATRENISLLASAINLFGQDRAAGVASLMAMAGPVSATTALLMEAASRDPSLIAAALARILIRLTGQSTAEEKAEGAKATGLSEKIAALIGRGIQSNPIEFLDKLGIGYENALARKLLNFSDDQTQGNSDKLRGGLRGELLEQLKSGNLTDQTFRESAGKALFLLDVLGISTLPENDEMTIAFPWMFGQNSGAMTMKVRGRAARDGTFRLDPDNCEVNLELEMSSLGHVGIGILMVDSALRVVIRAGDSEELKALEAESEFLVRALEQSQRYRVASLDFRIQSDKSGEDSGKGDVIKDVPGSGVSLDIRI